MPVPTTTPPRSAAAGSAGGLPPRHWPHATAPQPPQPLLTWLRSCSQRFGLVLVAVTVLAWLWGFLLWFNARQKEQLLVDRGAEIALLAGAVAQHTSSVLRSAESDLRGLDLWLRIHPQAHPLQDANFLLFVTEMRQASKRLVDYRLISSDGLLYELPATAGKPRADVHDREYVTAHNDGQCRQHCPVYVGMPVLSRVTGGWVLPISMRLSAPGDAAAPEAIVRTTASAAVQTAARPALAATGALPRMRLLVAIVNLDMLAGEHERLRYGSGGSIVLMRSDGIVLSRTPQLPGFIGTSLSRSDKFTQEYGRKPRGSFVSDGRVSDNVQRLVSYERLHDYAVTALVSRTTDEMNASHDRRVRTPLLASAALSVLVLAFTVFLQRSRGSQLALRAQQEHFRRLATTDELTGVVNRRAFLEAANREFERAQRYKRPTVLLALDIDHFKRINDTHGHAGGDLALRMCASRWLPALREHDLLGRVGGEEFCVLLPETTAEHAGLIAERLRSVTEATPVMGDVRCSVSIGWTTMAAADSGLAAMMERADQALYQAKHNGRNRVWPAPA